MDLSIVSGTYNRLSFLERMVVSARKSMMGVYGLEYEFVLVDGNSTDGTQQWCSQQSDVHLIQHGSLLGAIKAFNDGAYAARGEYVILANDDIEFLGDSVLRAWVYMQTHPDCGVGCFYQDRNKRDWHVEEMPVVRDGRQAHEPYGQVCIVPKWLGDRVGWWGRAEEFEAKGLAPPRTYGGDNELSSNVYETGYKVSPIPECRVHDNEPQDQLRKANNIRGASDPRAVRGHHPDSWAWGKKWRDERANLVGPVIRDKPIVENPLQGRERVLYLPIYEPGWAVQKEQKRGLREALAKCAVVLEYDYMGRNQVVREEIVRGEAAKYCELLNPTVVLTQLHNGDILGPGDVSRMRSNAPNAIFVNWNGDFWPEQLLDERGKRLARAFDFQTVVNRDVLDEYRKDGIQAAYWQIGWEPDGVGHAPEGGECFDLVFLASGYSNSRHKLVRDLRGLDWLRFGLWGQGWPEGWSRGQCLYDFIAACKIYRSAKVSLGDSQWPESGFVSNRVMQALAAGGSALAHQWFRGMEELGLEDGKTCIIWRTFDELKEKLRYYLDHEEERANVARAGQMLALERHSFDARVNELFRLLGKQASEAGEDWRF